MTWGNTITLWCDSDDCVEWQKFQARKVTRARTMAESDGWDTTRGGPDYCPDCAVDTEANQ